MPTPTEESTPTPRPTPTMMTRDPSDVGVNTLMEQAESELAQAKYAEQTSFRDALPHYEAALAKLEELITSHPGSQLTASLRRGDTLIEGITYQQFRDVEIQAAQWRADGETDPFAAAVYVASLLEDPFDHSRAFTDIAQYIDSSDRAYAVFLVDFVADRTLELEARQQEFPRQFVSRAYAKLGEFDKAITVAGGIQNPSSRARALADIGIAYADAGEIERALVMAEQAEQAANAPLPRGYGIPIPPSRRQPWNYRGSVQASIAGAYARIGDFNHALTFSSTITDTDSWSHSGDALGNIADAYVNAGKYKEADEVIGKITRLEAQFLAYIKISKTYSSTPHQNDRAIGSRSSICAPSRGRAAWRHQMSLAEAYALAGAFTEARRVADAMTDLDNQSYALGLIAAAYATADQSGEATQLFVEAVQLGKRVPQENRGNVFAALVRLHVDAGRFETALALTRLQLEPVSIHRARALAYLGQGFVEREVAVDTSIQQQLHAIIAQSRSEALQ